MTDEIHQLKLIKPSPELNPTSIEWQPIIPLSSNSDPETPYPIDALPAILQKAVSAYKQYGQQPLSLIACGALANISLACQAQANVARDHYLISPVSLYFLVVAKSGERKSASDNIFSKAIRNWERKIRQKRSIEIKTALTLHEAWRMEKDGLLMQIKRSMMTGEDTDFYKDLLERLIRLEPEIPLLPTLYFQDVTQEALALHLANGCWASGSLWSDEAGTILNSHGMQSSPTRFVALLNQLWDGKTFTAHRKTSQSFEVQYRRLTINLMMQPLLLQQMLAKSTNINRQSGFLASCLLAYPTSTMGHRLYNEPPIELACLQDYEKRITDCLDQSRFLTHAGCIDLPVLYMTPSAKKQWVKFFNSVEIGLKPDGYWVDIRDFASKSAENVARLAALLHLFAGKEGDINAEHTEQAIQIIKWHLQEARRLLTGQSSNQDLAEANKLMNWLIEKGSTKATMRTLQRLGPLRNKEQLDNAITTLTEHNFLHAIKEGSKTSIEINPGCLTL